MSAGEVHDQMLSRLKLTAIHDQLDSLLDESSRQQLTLVDTLTLVRSPRVRCCSCAGRGPGTSFSPLIRVVPACMTPELEYQRWLRKSRHGDRWKVCDFSEPPLASYLIFRPVRIGLDRPGSP